MSLEQSAALMESALPNPVISAEKKQCFAPWNWLPFLAGCGGVATLLLALITPALKHLAWPALAIIGLASLYFFVQFIARLAEKRWVGAVFAFFRIVAMVLIAWMALGAVVFFSFFGPSEDHFADDLVIPEGIEIAEPDKDSSEVIDTSKSHDVDALQAAVRAALEIPGSSEIKFAPHIPSLRRASLDHARALREYLEASPDWHVFTEGGNHFAARRWSYGGEPRNELHGYISEFDGAESFQTRCLICIDRRQWSRYTVQHVEEGSMPAKPQMSMGNGLHESRVMIECGGVWVEIFEESGKPERRVTKATLAALQEEFSEFVKDPEEAIKRVQEKNRDLARSIAGNSSQPFRLRDGMQPGIYEVMYALNPGEPGWVYLKAFEVTKGTPLSVERLEKASTTRLPWSTNPHERFGAKAGFTIYEGDWGKPYAARFEVWFNPDSGKGERKLAERNFKIQGWQR